MYKPTREDYLLFAQYSDQIDRSVRAEVDACVSVFPSRQPFHAARVMDESEYRQQLARAREAEAHRLNRIVEVPQCSRCGSLTVRPGMCRQCFEAGPLPCPYDTPEPRMTWLGVIWGALVVFALWVRDVLARLTGRAG